MTAAVVALAEKRVAGRTRDRIVDTARRLFNEQRYGKVTLAALAGELGMAKGNLWYHFRDKPALLAAITELFLERVADRARREPEPHRAPESYVAFLTMLAEEMRDFRFMYRDQADYGEHSDSLLARLPDIYDRVLAQFAAFFEGMRREGHLAVDEGRIESLALNAVLVLRYYLEFSRERGDPGATDAGAVGQAMAQHLTLFDDRLSPGAARYLRAALGAG